MCITPALCISGGKLWFLVLVEKTGAWLVVTENVGVSCFGCFFPTLFWLCFQSGEQQLGEVLPSNFKASGGFLISHSLFPCPSFLLSLSACVTSSLSPCTNLAAERKRTTGIFVILLILIPLSLFGSIFSLCYLCFEP